MSRTNNSNGIRVSAIVCGVLASIIVVIIWYLAQPALNLRNDGFWWCLFGTCLVFGAFAGIEAFHQDYSDNSFLPITKVHYILFALPVLILVLIAIFAFTGAPINNAETYKNVVSVEECDFNEDFKDISFDDNSVFMDLDTAQRLGDRVLGSVPNASIYEIDKEYNLIVYNGKQYRISPLKYGGLFKYLKGKNDGIPGYVLVDCQTSEAKFVQANIKYSPSAFFSYNLKRHLRSQFPNLVFASHFMEIDDEGTPFWVTAVSEPQAGVWGARKVVGFILTDAYSGESKYHEMSEKPEWLDHVQSLSYMMDTVNWHFRYVNGWWNPSNNGVLRTTYSYAVSKLTKDSVEPNFYGYTSFVDDDGDVMIFTGVTPVNRTESNVGFLIINASTGEYKYYQIPGAEESSAQSVVEGLIQNMGYQSTFPFMVNISGRPTYLMNMKDKSGLIQRVAMVEYENYSHAFVGKDFKETLEGYLQEIGETSKVIFENPNSAETIDGEIKNIYEAMIDGTTYYYYIIGDEVFKASILVNELQVLFNAGDSVHITYFVGDEYNVIKEIKRK